MGCGASANTAKTSALPGNRSTASPQTPSTSQSANEPEAAGSETHASRSAASPQTPCTSQSANEPEAAGSETHASSPPRTLAEDDFSIGVAVYLSGLKSRSDLNGEAGTCERFDSTTSRWIVVLSLSGDEKALKTENLRPQRAVLKPGTIVKIRELKRCVKLNGQAAKFQKWLDAGRCNVCLVSNSENKSIKEQSRPPPNSNYRHHDIKAENLVPNLPEFLRPAAPIIDQNLLLQASLTLEDLPELWSNHRRFLGHAFDQTLYVQREHHAVFNLLLQATYKAACTFDRPCPKGTCEQEPGGCPCVGPGGDPGLPTGYKVLRVLRVEDSGMWGRYHACRTRLEGKHNGDSSSFDVLDPPVRTKETSNHPEVFGRLNQTCCEIYLWHGTRVRDAMQIAQHDFVVDFAGKNAGCMLGKGVYLSDSCTKADEYGKDDPDTHYEGVYAMLLCRVCMGNTYYTVERDFTVESKVKSNGYDSVICDREIVAGTFREFIVYDRDQVYPEFVILYSREFASGVRSFHSALHSFQMELPVYWKNFHRNPTVESFNEQFVVNIAQRTLLDRLSAACYLEDGSGHPLQPRGQLVRARRIENSRIWNRYVKFKAELRARVQSRGDTRCKYAREFDGCPDIGQVLTLSFIRSEEHADQPISIENLEEDLCEHLLWHGTSRAAAESIAQVDFCIPRSRDGDVLPGLFGTGIYFAENLSKSFQYAPKEDNTRFVLLCRVCCGDMLYTEEEADVCATDDAVEAGKDCVLAHREKSFPREFVALGEEQVYPEFILEFTES